MYFKVFKLHRNTAGEAQLDYWRIRIQLHGTTIFAREKAGKTRKEAQIFAKEYLDSGLQPIQDYVRTRYSSDKGPTLEECIKLGQTKVDVLKEQGYIAKDK